MKSYAFLRSLYLHDINVIVASEYDWIPLFWSRFCTDRVSVPSPETDLVAYKDALLEIAARPGVETIVPVREYDAYILAKYHEEFERHVSFVGPNIDTLSKVHDRLQLAKEARKADVPVAETRPLSAVDRLTTDVVIKSRYNVLTDEYIDSFAPSDAMEVRYVGFLAAGKEVDSEAIRDQMHHDPIVQDYVPEASKHLYCALWDQGEPVATYQHRQIRKNSWVGGGGVYRESIYSQTVDELAVELLSHLDWHGFACIEYIKDRNTGEWKFLEINPRIWQSIPEAVRAGVDFPYYYWLCARGKTESIDSGYSPGIACHNAYGELSHLLSIYRDDSPFCERPSFFRTLREIAASCVTEPRFEYIRLDDPGLFFGGVREAFSNGISKEREYSTLI